MTDREEGWGPWIEHDGLGMPVPPGAYIQVEYLVGARKRAAKIVEGVVRPIDRRAGWNWFPVPKLCNDIIRYRVAKPRALRDLIELVETMPARERERVDA